MTLAQVSICAETEAALKRKAQEPKAEPGTLADLQALAALTGG